MMHTVLAFPIVISLFLVLWWLPVIVAYARGIRGHRLNVIIMWPGYVAILALVWAVVGGKESVDAILERRLGVILLNIPWVVALVMAVVCKPRKRNL